jgi:DNA processing protein
MATVGQRDQTRYWVGISRVKSVGPNRIARLLEHFGDLERAWTAPAAELRAVIGDRAAENLVKTRAELALDAELDRIAAAGITVLTRDDPAYPRPLAEIPAPPPVLYAKGHLAIEDGLAVAIVGTRRMTGYGRDVTHRLATDLAEAGVTIVSGLALGVDAIAHQAALRAGGRTLAVLGCGVNVVYPSDHGHLARRVVEGGALLSDYPPDRKADAPNFPARNRIIAGLTLATIVTEAPERSGALITTAFAADYGRDVFVVPGSVLAASSAGCNRLLREGARPVTCADDVLDDLNLGRRRDQVAVQAALPLDDDERRVLALLSAEPQHIDEIAAAAGLGIAEAGALLLTMELKGLVRNGGAQHYARA